MSSANGCVLFPDGTIRYAVYHGTVDLFHSDLHDDPETAWQNRTSLRDEEGEVFDVILGTDYGYGSYWPGTATRDRIVSGHSPCGEEYGYGLVRNVPEVTNIGRAGPPPQWWPFSHPSQEAVAGSGCEFTG